MSRCLPGTVCCLCVDGQQIINVVAPPLPTPPPLGSPAQRQKPVQLTFTALISIVIPTIFLSHAANVARRKLDRRVQMGHGSVGNKGGEGSGGGTTLKSLKAKF